MTVPADERRLSTDEKTEVGSGITSPPELTTEKNAQDTAVDQKAAEDANEDDKVYPKGITLLLIIVSLCLAVFLVALDQTIIAPALGAITAEYKSVKDIVSLNAAVAYPFRD